MGTEREGLVDAEDLRIAQAELRVAGDAVLDDVLGTGGVGMVNSAGSRNRKRSATWRGGDLRAAAHDEIYRRTTSAALMTVNIGGLRTAPARGTSARPVAHAAAPDPLPVAGTMTADVMGMPAAMHRGGFDDGAGIRLDGGRAQRRRLRRCKRSGERNSGEKQ